MSLAQGLAQGGELCMPEATAAETSFVIIARG